MAEPFNGGDQTALPADAEVFVTRDGKRGTIPRADLDEYKKHGWQLETPEGTTEARDEKEYGDRPLEAAAQGAARTITFGGSDLFLRALDQDQDAAKLQRHNEGAAFAGELGGAVLGAGVGLGGAVSSAGRAVEGAVAGEGAQLGARLLGAGAKGAAEGVVYGAGQGVSETALSKDPVEWESAAATIGSDALGGAVLGGGIGIGGQLLAEGAGAAKRLANAQIEKFSAPEAAAVDRSAYPDIAPMDKKAAREAIGAEREAMRAQRATDLVEGKAARQAEVDVLEQAKGTEATQLHHDLVEYKNFLREDPSAFITTADKEAATVLKKSKMQIMKGLDNPEGFIERRGSGMVVDGLQKQKKALTSVLADADEVLAGAGAERQAMLDALPKSGEGELYLTPEQSKLYSKWADVVMLKGQPSLTISADELPAFRAAIERGEVNPPQLQRVLNAQALLEKNQQLLDKFAALKKPVASPALEAIDAKLEAARAGVNKSERLAALEAHVADLSEDTLGRKLAKHVGGAAGGSVGFGAGGFVGAMAGHEVGADLGAKVYDKLVRKIKLGNAMRAKSMAASVAHLFASGSEKVSKGLTKAAAPLASKILPAIRYAQPAYVDGMLGPANQLASKSKLVDDFRSRARELNALTERKPDGTYDVRMNARQDLNLRLQGIWAADPDAANGIEKTHNARLMFLASKLPRDPSPAHLQAGPETWEPSHAEMAKFARYMEAVERPETIVARLSTSTMTPEDAEVMRTVYPQMYAAVQGQIQDHIAELRERLPYQERLALSIYLDTPVDPAVTPEAITVYQGLYANDQAQGPGGGAASGVPAPPTHAWKSSEQATRAQKQGEA